MRLPPNKVEYIVVPGVDPFKPGDTYATRSIHDAMQEIDGQRARGESAELVEVTTIYRWVRTPSTLRCPHAEAFNQLGNADKWLMAGFQQHVRWVCASCGARSHCVPSAITFPLDDGQRRTVSCRGCERPMCGPNADALYGTRDHFGWLALPRYYFDPETRQLRTQPAVAPEMPPYPGTTTPQWSPSLPPLGPPPPTEKVRTFVASLPVPPYVPQTDSAGPETGG